MTLQELPHNIPDSHDLRLPSGNPQAVDVFPASPEEGAVYLTPTMPGIGSENWVAMTSEEQQGQLLRGKELYKGIAAAAGLKMNELSVEARTDKLTGLSNRLKFGEELDKAVSEVSKDPKAYLDLVFVDLDKFKKANDEFGHETGDLVLSNVGDELSNFFRAGDTVARLGGDEFVALVRNNPLQNSEDVAPGHKPRIPLSEDATLEGFSNRLEEAIKQAGRNAKVPFIGASIGIVKYEQGETAKQFLDRADRMMYANKKGRKDAEAIIKAVKVDLSGEEPTDTKS